MGWGAWIHNFWLIALGLTIVAAAWCRGLIRPAPSTILRLSIDLNGQLARGGFLTPLAFACNPMERQFIQPPVSACLHDSRRKGVAQTTCE